MTAAILLVACAALAGAVVVLAVSMRRVTARVAALETRGLVPGTRVPSSTTAEPSAPDSVPVAEEAVGRSSSGPPRDPVSREFVITRLGEEPQQPAPTMETRLFADLVLRESVVKAASWAYAVHRGLSPANRNRIWFEMRREVKRARKDRKAEEREAIRQYRARRRAAVQENDAA